jgi:hypothetical protein
MTTREQVYAAIDSERNYQEAKWGGHFHEAESWVLFIEHYAHQARTKASTTDFSDFDNLNAYLSDLRKIATLAVAAMEQHGAPQREGF